MTHAPTTAQSVQLRQQKMKDVLKTLNCVLVPSASVTLHYYNKTQ